MSSVTDILRAELEALEAELAADPRQQKVLHIKGLLELYGASPAPRQYPSPPPRPRLSGITAQETRRISRPVDPGRLAVLTEIERMLEGADDPVKTSFLFELLSEDLRSKIGGRDPKSNLSAMLSNSDRFVSHGRQGWTLKKEESPTEATEPPQDPLEDLLG